jgi:hypothetical protein
MVRSLLLCLLAWPLLMPAQESRVSVDVGNDGVKRYFFPDKEKSRFERTIEQLWSVVVGAPPFGRSVAFLIGVSDYRHLKDLPSVKRDLDKMRSFLLERGHFDEVYEVRDEAVTRELIETYMTEVLPSRLKPDG